MVRTVTKRLIATTATTTPKVFFTFAELAYRWLWRRRLLFFESAGDLASRLIGCKKRIEIAS